MEKIEAKTKTNESAWKGVLKFIFKLLVYFVFVLFMIITTAELVLWLTIYVASDFWLPLLILILIITYVYAWSWFERGMWKGNWHYNIFSADKKETREE